MKIKSGLAFSKSCGKLIGFYDLGSVNSEPSDQVKIQEYTPELSSHTLILPLVPFHSKSFKVLTVILAQN